MIMYLTLIMLAIALSLDSFSVGFTYGLRNLKIPTRSTLVISICTATVMTISMYVGVALSHVFSPFIAQKIGGVVLIGMGCWILYQFFRPEKEYVHVNVEKMVFNLEIKSLGVAIQILRKPMDADFDKSGSISGIEAFMLGIALSLDSFGAGIGVSLLGYHPFLMGLMVGVMSFLLLNSGRILGQLFSEISWIQRFTFLPGILLIIIGFWKL